MKTALLVATLVACVWSLRAVGPLALGGRPLPSYLRHASALLPPALLAALIASQTLTRGQTLAIDARLAGLAAGVLALVARLPLVMVLVAAAAATALARTL